jgi:hypothetical protein
MSAVDRLDFLRMPGFHVDTPLSHFVLSTAQIVSVQASPHIHGASSFYPNGDPDKANDLKLCARLTHRSRNLRTHLAPDEAMQVLVKPSS